MSHQDLAAVIGIAILILGIVAMGVNAFLLLFPKTSSGFSTPADEYDARRQVNQPRDARGERLETKHPA